MSEVPIAFWAWRTQAPSSADVQKAFAATNANTLFLRAGQFDSVDGSVRRIRPVSGALPSSVEIHLVYNGTRKFLHEWDKLETSAIAETVADTYQADLLRAHNDHAEVNGLQLDFDVPDRILPRYAQMLQRLRELLPPNTKLSITGLPGWAATNDIKVVLAAVDFWIPQCYGATIPAHVNERVPISSPSDVAHTISRVRQLGKPFYAGLAAYSYAILYAKDGSLLELRGDIDPGFAAQNASLELIERQSFKRETWAGELRYEYRAKSDLVLDGLIIQAGETLVFDLPSAASLRTGARAVRENAGELLLGICVFRLPTAGDGTTLSVGEIAAALTDTQTNVATAITLETIPGRQLKLHAENSGIASTILSEDSLTIDLSIPAGSINGASSLAGFTAYETLCRYQGMEMPRPCSEQRANVVRLKARAWSPGTTASITFSLKNALPATLPAVLTTRVNDGRIERESFELQLQNRGE